MPVFNIINNVDEITLNSDWVPSTKFNSKDRVVDENGEKIGADYQGRQYQIVEKREYVFSTLERIGRGLLGTLVVVLSLGIALIFKSVRDLFIKEKLTIRFGIVIPVSSDIDSQNTSPFPLDEVRKACQQWMNTFLKDFEPSTVKKYTIAQLYLNDVVSSQEETEAMQGVHKTLWGESGISWTGHLPEGWTHHSGSVRSYNVENSKYPGYIFKVCSGVPGRGVPASHFLRVPKGMEVRRIIHEENLDELEVVNERLIALKSQNEIQKECEREQCYHFVVKSEKIDLLSETDTISKLSSLSQQEQIKIATQIMRMICKSGLGDVGFHNFQINKETGKLVIVDTEPIFGSLLLDEKPTFDGQYRRSNKIMQFSKNSQRVTSGINAMIKACNTTLPVFEQVAKVYKECFPVYSH